MPADERPARVVPAVHGMQADAPDSDFESLQGDLRFRKRVS